MGVLALAAIAAIGLGLLLALMTVARSSTRAANVHAQRAAVSGLLLELSEILKGETIDSIRALRGSPSPALHALAGRRIASLPQRAQACLDRELELSRGKLSLTLDEGVGGLLDLDRVTLTAAVGGSLFRCSWLFRASSLQVGLDQGL